MAGHLEGRRFDFNRLEVYQAVVVSLIEFIVGFTLIVWSNSQPSIVSITCPWRIGKSGGDTQQHWSCGFKSAKNPISSRPPPKPNEVSTTDYFQHNLKVVDCHYHAHISWRSTSYFVWCVLIDSCAVSDQTISPTPCIQTRCESLQPVPVTICR